MKYEKGNWDMTDDEVYAFLDECVKDAENTEKRLKYETPICSVYIDEDSLESLNGPSKVKVVDNSQLDLKDSIRQENKTMENQSIPEEQVNMNIPAEVKIPDNKIGDKKEKPHLNGREITITDVKLEAATEIATTKSGKSYRAVLFKVFYGNDTYENYGGFRQYKNGDVFSPVTIWNESKASGNILFNKWLDKVGKKREEVSYKDFVDGLKGMKAKLIEVNVMYQGNTTHKNIVDKFM